MNYYVTLFDKKYLPHGLALYNSMCKFCLPFKLIILCVDDLTFNTLKALDLKHIQLLKLSDLENQNLKKIKKKRTHVEYCWTLTPFSILFAFEFNPKINQITYIDSDIFFLKNPKKIFDELNKNKKEILITRHGFAKEYDQSHISGEFCVQFIPVKREALDIIDEWKKKCLKWCYNRAEDGKFGDQKYLELWPKKYHKRVHICENDKWFLAPWNAIRFNYYDGIIWHFHAAKIFTDKNFKLVGLKCIGYKIPEIVKNNVYKKYFMKIKNSISILEKMNFRINNNYHSSIKNLLFEFTKKILNKNHNFLIK